MRHTKILLSLLLSLSLCSNFALPITRAKSEYVYICQGRYSKVYHKSPTCRGLSNCSTKIYKVTLEEAKKMGRRPCKLEY
jgi:nitrogenase subunit NifH